MTIDPATARDFDDAISLSRDEKGYWSLGVHIADVSHFVKAGSALDRTAKHRGTSVYLPDRVIPMLPEILSNSLASLQAGRTRYTVSALLEFNAEGILTSKEFARSAIRVDHRFTYEQAMAVMKDPGAEHPGVAPAVAAMLGRMLELAMILRRRRFARGALELNLPEVEIDLGESGEVTGAHLAVNDQSHQVIEEFMLAANEAVAAALSAQEILFLRRAHPDPEPFKLDEFAEFARSLGLQLDQPQSRFELQRILAETAGKPEEYAVHYGLLRSLKQANYTPEPEGHYALASDDYCHFTSPIRRYPDLQVHRQLVAWLEGKKPSSRHDELVVLAEHCTRTERRAEAAERELIRVKLLTYLEGRIGDSFHAVIIGRAGLRPVLPPGRAAHRGPDPRHVAGRRLLLPRGRDAHARRPTLRAPPPPGRPRAGPDRPRGRGPPRPRPRPGGRPAGARPGPPSRRPHPPNRPPALRRDPVRTATVPDDDAPASGPRPPMPPTHPRRPTASAGGGPGRKKGKPKPASKGKGKARKGRKKQVTADRRPCDSRLSAVGPISRPELHFRMAPTDLIPVRQLDQQALSSNPSPAPRGSPPPARSQVPSRRVGLVLLGLDQVQRRATSRGSTAIA